MLIPDFLCLRLCCLCLCLSLCLIYCRLANLCSDLGSPLDYNTLESALLILDVNVNGKISYDEFIGWYKGYK
jgi:hypothetical protein